MVKLGMALLFVAALILLLVVISGAITEIPHAVTQHLTSSVILAFLVAGVVLLFAGVVVDRIKERQEEDKDDLSKY